MQFSRWLLPFLPLVIACGNTQQPSPPKCTALDASCPTTPPSFQTDVLPLLDRACNSSCHAPGVGPWPLIDYSDVSDWATIIQEDTLVCAMPPPDAGVPFSDGDRATLLSWIACGSPNN